MSPFYSGGRSRPRGGYNRGRGRGGYYDNSGSRFHRERRDYGSSGSRAQLEIARKLVDTLMAGGHRSDEEKLFGSGGGGGGFRRSRDSFDRFDMSGGSGLRRFIGEHTRRLSDVDDGEREFRRQSAFGGGARRARGFASNAPRRDFPRGGANRGKGGRTADGRAFMPLRCPHCKLRCSTFSQYRQHQLGREHLAAMRRVMTRVRTELTRMRLAQREHQTEMEDEQKKVSPDFGDKPQLECTLCKLQYREIDGVNHEQTEWHVKQKAYQNPACQLCGSSYPTRISYEKHLGSLTHLEKVYQTEKNDAAAFKQGDFVTLDEVGNVDGAEEGVAAVTSNGGVAGKAAAKDGDKSTAAAAVLGSEGGELAAETLKKLGEYDGKTPVASDYMYKTEVFFCSLCGIYIKITNKSSFVVAKHVSGRKHYDNYRKKLTTLAAEQEEAERVRREQQEAEQRQQEEEEEDGGDVIMENRVVRGPAADEKMDDGEDLLENGGGDSRVVRSIAAKTASGEEADGTTTASWENLDDNFILGDDQDDIKDD